MSLKVIDFDWAMLLIEEAYNRGWMDSVHEPRPFKAARDSMRAKHMRSVELETAHVKAPAASSSSEPQP